VSAYDHAARTPRSAAVTFARERRWALVVWTAAVAWATGVFAMARLEYLNFRLAYYDLGNMVQAVWSTAHGRPLEGTLSTGEQAVRLGGHVDPILALFAPLWWAAPSPLLLAGVQVATVALGALPIYWLGCRHLELEKAAALLALAYLLYPWLAWTAIDAFHPVTLAIPLLLYAAWFLDSHRLGAFVACAVLVAATSELMGFAIAGLGMWYWLARARPRAGIRITVAGIGWTVICLKVIIPAFGGTSNSFASHYSSVGGSPEGIVWTLITDPGAILTAVTSGRDAWYVLWLTAPLVGAFMLAPGMAAIAVPQLAVNTLTDLQTATDPRHHYVAGLIPFLFAASAMGIARLRFSLRTSAAAAVLSVTAVFALILGPWPALPGPGPARIHPYVTARHVNALRAAVALVPEGVAVSTTNTAGSHLAERRYLFTIPVVRQAEWIVLDGGDPWMGVHGSLPEGLYPERLRAFRSRIQRNPEWHLVFERDGVAVFRRVSLP